MSARIALVDDHALVRAGFQEIVTQESDIDVVFECSELAAATQFLNRQPDLDLLIVDISLGDSTGFELIKLARKKGIKSLVVSMHAREPYISEAIQAGASGYISKASAASDLTSGINAIINGSKYFSADIECRIRSKTDSNPFTELTVREFDVCLQLLKGIEIKKLAYELGISPKTAYVHKANAFEKLGISSIGELIALANEHRLTSSAPT